MSATKVGVLFLAILVLAAMAACGSDDDASLTSTATSTQTPPATASAIPTTNSGVITAVAAPAQSKLPLPDPSELHTVSADGRADQLVFASVTVADFAWSPDGKWLALLDGEAPYGSALVRILGRDGEQLAGFLINAAAAGIEWSPDGRFVVTIAGRASSGSTTAYSIVALPAAGGQLRELLTSESNAPMVTAGWLPSGELLVVAAIGEDMRLLAASLDGKSRQLSELPVEAGFFGGPALSPDGTLVAMTVVEGASQDCPVSSAITSVQVLDLRSGEARKVIEPRCGDVAAVWSPDGSELAISNLGQERGLWLVNAGGGVPRRLSEGLDRPVSWRADGSIIGLRYHCTGCDAGPPAVWRIGAETGDYRELAPGGQTEVSPATDVIASSAKDITTIGFDGGVVATLAQADAAWQYGAVSWSQDGAELAYVRSHSPGTRIFEVMEGSSDLTSVTSRDRDFKLSPDGSRIAFVRIDDSNQAPSLYVANPDGSDETRVGEGGSVYEWSPDGSRLLFMAGSTATGQLISPTLQVVETDGSAPRRIGAATPDLYRVPSWSPDGVHVGYVSVNFLHVIDVDSNVDVVVGEVSPYSTKISFSTDGRVAWSLAGVVHVANIDGTEIFTLPALTPNFEAQAVISPDGRSIAVLALNDARTQHQLVVVDIDSGRRKVVLEGQLSSSTDLPVWSPDSRSIALNVATASGRGIFIARADGSGQQQLVRGGNVTSIEWLDNERLRFTTSSGSRL
jgi:Tol biopolymer transport system component